MVEQWLASPWCMCRCVCAHHPAPHAYHGWGNSSVPCAHTSDCQRMVTSPSHSHHLHGATTSCSRVVGQVATAISTVWLQWLHDMVGGGREHKAHDHILGQPTSATHCSGYGYEDLQHTTRSCHRRSDPGTTRTVCPSTSHCRTTSFKLLQPPLHKITSNPLRIHIAHMRNTMLYTRPNASMMRGSGTRGWCTSHCHARPSTPGGGYPAACWVCCTGPRNCHQTRAANHPLQWGAQVHIESMACRHFNMTSVLQRSCHIPSLCPHMMHCEPSESGISGITQTIVGIK